MAKAKPKGKGKATKGNGEKKVAPVVEAEATDRDETHLHP